MPAERIQPNPTLQLQRPRPARPASAPFARPSISPAPDPRALCGFAAKLAAHHYEVSLADIVAPTRRSRRATRARHVAIYLAHIAYGLRLSAVGRTFGRSRRAAAYACRLIEDARDDPAFDAALASLELTAGVLLGREEQAA